MEKGELVSKKQKRGGVQERKRERELTWFWPVNPTRPANVTRSDLVIPATTPVEQATELKLRSRPLYSSHPRRQKTARTPVI